MPSPPFSSKTLTGAETRRLAGVVLLVEDDASVRAVARRMMELRGLRVIDADGPEEALRLATAYAGSIDVLLSDVLMPELTGPELAQRIRTLRPHLKVVFISGYPREDAFAGTEDDGTAEFLQKPFTPTQLADVLARLLTVDTPPPVSQNDTLRLPAVPPDAKP